MVFWNLSQVLWLEWVPSLKLLSTLYVSLWEEKKTKLNLVHILSMWSAIVLGTNSVLLSQLQSAKLKSRGRNIYLKESFVLDVMNNIVVETVSILYHNALVLLWLTNDISPTERFVMWDTLKQTGHLMCVFFMLSMSIAMYMLTVWFQRSMLFFLPLVESKNQIAHSFRDKHWFISSIFVFGGASAFQCISFV